MSITTWFKNGLVLLCLMMVFNCKEAPKKRTDTIEANKINSFLNPDNFIATVNDKQVGLYSLSNGTMEVAITNYGGRIVALSVPDKNNKPTNVTLGRGSIKDYLDSNEAYFGAIIGRVGNRISKGEFLIDEEVYTVTTNENGNTLHGGERGFHDVVWDAHQTNENSLQLSYVSADMEEGFPGELKVTVQYQLLEDNSLKITYNAVTNKSTVVNLTNHTYFNLNGIGSGTILNHILTVNANKFTPVDTELIPTGELRDVINTPFDFTQPTTIGARINAGGNQLKFGEGYDHNFVIEEQSNNMTHAASVVGNLSDIQMDVYTQEPGLQFYSGNFMASTNTLLSGVKDDYRTAFCLETQHYPDAPNHKQFPSIHLEQGETYKTETIYKFSIAKE